MVCATLHPFCIVQALTVLLEEDSAAPTSTGTGAARASTARATDEESATTVATTGRRATTDLNTAEIPTGTATRTRTPVIDDQAPVGGISMVTPAPTDPGTALYKIGTNVTFGWNYTNVLVNPTAIDVIASCSSAARAWTLTSNMTFESKGSYTWDTKELATDLQNPLLTDQYTLIVKDSETEVTDTPKAGYLSPNSGQFTFKMYKPQDYVPLSEWKCPTCSAAPPSLDSKVLPFVMTMSAATVLSFTWFAAGLSL